MQKNTVSVEANLHIKRSKTKTEKKVTIKEEPSTSSEEKLDSLIKTMERMMDKMSIKEKLTEPLIINSNYRGQQQQNQYRVIQRERDQDPTEQKIRPPFQQNYTQSPEEDEEISEANNFF